MYNQEKNHSDPKNTTFEQILNSRISLDNIQAIRATLAEHPKNTEAREEKMNRQKRKEENDKISASSSIGTTRNQIVPKPDADTVELTLRQANLKRHGGDYEKAEHLYRPVADQGNAMAQFGLGQCYEEKKYSFCRPKENPLFCARKEALHFYRLAAAQGYPAALWKLGEIYQTGLFHYHSEPEIIVDQEEKESINKAARFYHLAMAMSANQPFTKFDVWKILRIYQGIDKNSKNLNPTGRYHTLMTLYWYAVQSGDFNFASHNTLETGIHDLIENKLDENLLSAVLQQDPNPFLYSEEQKSVQIIIKALKEKLYGLFVLMTDISLFPSVLGNLIFQYSCDIPIHANWIEFAENLELNNSQASTSTVNGAWFFKQIKLTPSLQNGEEGVDKPNASINLDL